MDVAQTAALVAAIGGLVGAIAALLTPVVVAKIKSDSDKPDVAQGRRVPDPALNAERDRRRKAERERDAYRAALQEANDQAAAHGLTLHHPST